jgi:hypothetical protein
MYLKKIYISLLVLIFSVFYSDVSFSAQQYLSSFSKIGEARFSFALLNVYDVALYSEIDNFDRNYQFALEVKYLRSFKGESIAKRAASEIRKQGVSSEFTEQWYISMKDIFPDVREGDALVGVAYPEEGTRFFFNDKFIGVIEGSLFQKAFFDIWLGKKTSNRKITEKLMGIT